MKTSDIKDENILRFLSDKQGTWTCLFYSTFRGHSHDMSQAFPESTPHKLILSKMRNLHKRGLVGGCVCGCRGDFEITDKGLELIGVKRYTDYTGY